MKTKLIQKRYHISRRIGEGGLGSVYLAEDVLLRRDVALKTIRPDRIQAETTRLFRCEYEAMTRLRHPNLAQVLDFGYDDTLSQHFLVMEYCEGRGCLDKRGVVGSRRRRACPGGYRKRSQRRDRTEGEGTVGGGRRERADHS